MVMYIFSINFNSFCYYCLALSVSRTCGSLWPTEYGKVDGTHMSLCDHMSMVLQILATTLPQSLSGFEEESDYAVKPHVVSNNLWASFSSRGWPLANS